MNPPTVKQETPAGPSFLARPGGPGLAYRLLPGALPGVVFLGGFRSDMTGSKATALKAHCAARGQRFLRFDYSGHGASGGDFMDLTISHWRRDALDIITHAAPGPNILVGSSMGGWIALLAALAAPQQVAGLLGIASAPDFTERLIWQAFSPAQKEQMEREGVVPIPNCYTDQAPYPITRALIEDGRTHMLLDKPVPLNMPVRLLHGTADADVPWQMSQSLLEKLQSPDAQLTLIKNGDHRLSSPAQLARISWALDELLVRCA